ncbi:MAG: pilus assembly protein PilM, partial [Neisseriaceae bacterium]|nr:pilus assembly protein PilM [Neisseriaceae bacterium]
MRLKVNGKKSSNKGASVGFGKSIIGLDIGQNSIRMVQLSGKSINNIQVEKYAIEYLPQGVVSGKEIVDFQQLVSYLQQCYSKLSTSCKLANISLPFSDVTIEENVHYNPKDVEASLEEIANEQVSIVGSLDEMNYDWTVLHEDEETQDQTVLIVATRKDNVERCVDLADEIGVKLANVDVDLFASANAFLYADAVEGGEFSYERIALFDVGDTTMKCVIMDGGKIL